MTGQTGSPPPAAVQLRQRLAVEARHVGRAALRTFVEALAEGATDEDRREQEIYELIADLVAQDRNRQPIDVFPVIVLLCGGPGHPLAADLPAADEKLTAEVREWLLMIRLQYALPRSGPHHRTTELTFRTATGDLRRRTVRHRLDWADVPDPVREHQIRTGGTEVAFQLYPRSN